VDSSRLASDLRRRRGGFTKVTRNVLKRGLSDGIGPGRFHDG